MADRHGLDGAFRRPLQRRDSAYWSGEPGEGTMIRFSIWSSVYAGKPSFFAITCGGQAPVSRTSRRTSARWSRLRR